MNRIDALRSSQLFKHLPDDQLSKLAELGEERTLSAGWELIREHEEVSDLYVLVLGTVNVTKKGDRGDEEKIATLGSGSYFGEIEMLHEGHPAAATVSAGENCSAIVFSHASLREAFEADHELGFHAYRALSQALARRLVRTTGVVAHFQSMVVKHH